jgi:putative SOS response-associated peptidase YedK
MSGRSAKTASSLIASARKDLEPFAFAGIWEFARLSGEEILSTAIIVGEANPLVGGVHDRMPVMLISEDYDRWLGPTTSDDLKAMLKPYDPALMEAYAVNRASTASRTTPKSALSRSRTDPDSDDKARRGVGAPFSQLALCSLWLRRGGFVDRH